MIVIDLYEGDESGLLYRFEVSGHAGYAKRGSDIVCAGVSTLTYATIKALQSRFEVGWVEDEGYLACNIIKPDIAANLLTRAFCEGIKELQKQYPDNVTMHHHYL